MAQPFVWNVTPEVFSFSSVPRWYGLCFAMGYVCGYFIMRALFRRDGRPVEVLDSLLMHVVIGMMVGMRLVHCFFYEPGVYLAEPWRIPMIWEGGYASHGGFLGVIIALIVFSRKHRDVPFLWLADRMSIGCMVAAAWIRIGNFFNSEIIGRPTDGPFAIVFARVDQLPRHPSQLYEAAGYLGVALASFLLYRFTAITKVAGRLFGATMIMGFGWRFICEFSKEDQVAFEAGMPLNMGQLLSVPFIIIGIFLLLGIMQKAAGKSSEPAAADLRKKA